MTFYRTSAAERAARSYICALCPPRAKDAHKGTFGRAFLACGSAQYTGAAYLAAAGALQSGAGLVHVCAPEPVLFPLRVALPELILHEMPPITVDPAAYLPAMQAADAILIGPGIGCTDKHTLFADMISALLATPGAPVVLDADALNHLAAVGAVSVLRDAARDVVLTPHPLEFSRLCGLPLAEIQADRAGHACRFAQKTGCTVLLKGSGSVIASPDGTHKICPSGTPALAKGGTGDVLAGMLVAFLAQGLGPAEAAFVAAYLHGKAGEELATVYGERGVMPHALPAAAATVLCRILHTK